eukprot:8755151-Prorocentrum_lima.AAC.1
MRQWACSASPVGRSSKPGHLVPTVRQECPSQYPGGSERRKKVVSVSRVSDPFEVAVFGRAPFLTQV